MIVRVSVVLYKTVVDSDCGFDNLCGSQELYPCQLKVFWLLA